jgi:hypothetical protein
MQMKTIFPEIISNTDLSLWSECEMKWFRSRCQCLKKDVYNIDLSAGGAFASAMEITRKAFYIGKKSEQDSIILGRDFILKEMEVAEADNDLFGLTAKEELKSPRRMSQAFEQYFTEWSLEDMGEAIPFPFEDETGIEHRLIAELPITHPETGKFLIFKGKLDLLAKNNLNRLAMYDEKTCKSFSAKDQQLLELSGQFLGYAWLARENGLRVNDAYIRKIAIQKTGIKFKEFHILINDFAIDAWYESMYQKVCLMLRKYNMELYFIKDFGSGCSAFYKPCPYAVGCLHETGESELETNFQQLVWDSEKREEVLLEEFSYKD